MLRRNFLTTAFCALVTLNITSKFVMTPTEIGIRELFNELDEHSEIVKFENVKAYDNFTVHVRTKLENCNGWGKACDGWMGKLTVQTNSKWVVKTTFPKMQRIEYRKIYICRENSASSRNQNKSCRAKVDIKIKKVTESTIRKDHLLKSGYNGEIKVIFDHSHDR